MLGLAELARAGTALDERSIDHLHRLVAAWAPLADLSFADLLLYVPCTGAEDIPGALAAGPDMAARAAVQTGADGAAVQTGADGAAVQTGVDGAAVQTGADGAAVQTGVDGAAVQTGVDGAAVQTGADGAAAGGPSILAHAGALTAGGAGDGFVVLAHVRATTGPTVHIVDPVGARVRASACTWLRKAMADGSAGEAEIVEPGPRPVVGDDDVVEEQISLPVSDRRRVVDYVPVRCDGEPIAVLAREAALAPIRHDSPLETIYRGLYGRFALMIADGAFPYDRVEQMGEFREPRVSDGVMVHDREGRITYASPNASSALHRLGVVQTVLGCRLRDFDLDDTVIRRSFWRRRSTVAEFEAEPQTTVVLRAYPLMADNRITGAVALLRDVSELRHRDRLLVSKDATIREIHHRVKNNLQTVSSLLQLQARRLASAEAKAAVESSVRRISSIAMVHEHLSLDTTTAVDFDGIVRPLVRMVEEGLAASERPPAIRVEGTVGEIDGEVAMPLAVVLVELVQNAYQHASSAPRRSGGTGSGPGVAPKAAGPPELVAVRLGRTAGTVTMSVTDRGPGVPDGFSLDRDAGLGLTIVRTFVVHHLGGSISIRSASTQAPRGTVVDVAVPRQPATVPLG